MRDVLGKRPEAASTKSSLPSIGNLQFSIGNVSSPERRNQLIHLIGQCLPVGGGWRIARAVAMSATPLLLVEGEPMAMRRSSILSIAPEFLHSSGSCQFGFAGLENPAHKT